MSLIILSLALLSFSFLLVSHGSAAPAPRSARDLMIDLAGQAHANAVAAAGRSRGGDAKTWRAWEALYRRQAILPQVQAMSALQLIDNAANENAREVAADTAAGKAQAAAFFQASRDFWIALDREVRQGEPFVIRFPDRAMLTPVAGLPGTPWAGPPVKATASDCAAIAQRVRQCEADVAGAMHHDMMGLGEDQSGYALVRRQQCNRWEEARLAYCPAH